MLHAPLLGNIIPASNTKRFEMKGDDLEASQEMPATCRHGQALDQGAAGLALCNVVLIPLSQQKERSVTECMERDEPGHVDDDEAPLGPEQRDITTGLSMSDLRKVNSKGPWPIYFRKRRGTSPIAGSLLTRLA